MLSSLKHTRRALPAHAWVRSMGHGPKSIEDSATSIFTQFIPKEYIQKFREAMLFKEGKDIHNLNQAPDPRVQMPGVPRIKGYRYPAPGSRPAPCVPVRTNEDSMYNNNYYVRDTKRNVVTTEMHLPPKIALERGVPELSDGRPTTAMGKPGETQGSPGNKNAAVLDYDPSGLRSAMSATQESLDASLVTYMPDHLPTYPWEDPEVQAKAIAEWEKNGLPPTPGLAFKWKVPKVAREEHW